MNIDTLQSSKNIAELLSEDQLQKIGNQCLQDLMTDITSRKPWEDKMADAMKIATQLTEKKNVPWDNASNVKFPLLPIAAIQFSSRVYPQLFSSPRPVKMRVIGKDEKSEKHQRASRISEHMSYQCLEEDEDWLSEHDKMLIALPIMGSAFVKTYHNGEHTTSCHVHAKDLVVNYYAKSLETCACYTHCFPLYKNEVIERQRDGRYIEHDLMARDPSPNNQLSQARDDRQGMVKPPTGENTPLEFYEQYCYLDLDEDDYKEPYTVTFDQEGRVHRIINRFKEVKRNSKGQIAKIIPKHYFDKFTFIPSPDGGFYDMGFGTLLTPVNESVNTLINQLIDAGTLANRQGGFLGRGARLKGGQLKYKMGEFTPINATGDDIKKNIFLMPFKEPSQVLFTLLTYLVEYGERLSSVSDMMVGKTPGQNTPATTAMAALEEGMRVFTAIYQRVYRGLKKEFQKRYMTNGEYLDPREYYETEDDQKAIFQQDYLGDPKDVRPAADPNMSSDVQRLMRLEALGQRAAAVPGYNVVALERRYLEALNVEGIDEIFPIDENGNAVIQPASDPKVEIESFKFQADQQYKAHMLEIERSKLEMDAAVKETTAILNLAKAEREGNKTDIEAYKALVEKIKAEKETNETNREGRVSGMESGSSESNGDEVS